MLINSFQKHTTVFSSVICFFLLIITINLDASKDLSFYLKRNNAPLVPSTVRNIDCIYVLNLDERPDKFQEASQRLAKFGIYPNRFSAVNGWNLDFQTIEDVGLKYQYWMKKGIKGVHYHQSAKDADYYKLNNIHTIEDVNIPGRTYFAFGVSLGTVGIALSHLSILKDAYDKGYETIWVMEDDIKVIRNPHILSNYIDDLDYLLGKRGWDILFTDMDTVGRDGRHVPCFSHAERPDFQPANISRFSRRVMLSNSLRRIGARYGAYSMILRKSGIEKILRYFEKRKIFLPYDLEYCMPNDIFLVSPMMDIVSTEPNAKTDNSAPKYRISE